MTDTTTTHIWTGVWGNEKNATALNQIEKNGHLKKEMSHSDDNFMVV